VLIGTENDGTEVRIDPKTLTTHAAVLGSTGSGKTGLLINLAEELQEKDIPTILVDIKGDMLNIAIQEAFKGQVRLITPGSLRGETVNLFGDLGSADYDKRETAVCALLGMLEEEATESVKTFLLESLRYTDGTIEGLLQECANPAMEYIHGIPVDKAFPKRKRNRLIEQMASALSSHKDAYWDIGASLDIDDLIQNSPTTVYSVAHLHREADQMAAISILANEVVSWMKKQEGSQDLQMVLMIDECVGLLPPTSKPVTKEPLIQLLKQARASGIGVILGTQNPVDIDYKALSNCGTWIVGRMTAPQDYAKVAAAMQAKHTIPNLQPRQFILRTAKQFTMFFTRDTRSKLLGPMTTEYIDEMYEDGYLTWHGPKRAIEPEPMPEEEEFEWPDKYYFKESVVGLGLLGVYGFALTLVLDKVSQWIK
jgi:hypothetical protein